MRGTAAPPLTPVAGDVARFPFVLVPFRGLGYAEGGMRQLAWLRELPLGAGDPWPERIEIALNDAQRLGVEDGDTVVVESPMAQVMLRAQVRAGIKPGVLGLPRAQVPGQRVMLPQARPACSPASSTRRRGIGLPAPRAHS